MIRVRFHANGDDPRPVKVPPPGPYWITGEGDGFSTVVAYVNSEEEIRKYWPEVGELTVFARDVKPVFSARFPRPEWWRD